MSYLFVMLPNADVVDIENSDGIFSLIFAADEFSRLFLYPSISPIIHLRSA